MRRRRRRLSQRNIWSDAKDHGKRKLNDNDDKTEKNDWIETKKRKVSRNRTKGRLKDREKEKEKGILKYFQLRIK